MMTSSPSLIQLPECKQSLNLSGVCTTWVIGFSVEIFGPGKVVVPKVDEISVRKHEAGRAAREDLIPPPLEEPLFVPGADRPFRNVKKTSGLLRRVKRENTAIVRGFIENLGYCLPDQIFKSL